MLIRKLRPGEELILRTVFHSSVHQLARAEYSPEQLSAWAPSDFEPAAWISNVQALNPWVVDVQGEIVAYADLQADGYIDHFYVSGSHGRRGYGAALLSHLVAEAKASGLELLFSKVSHSAQPLFLKHGFGIRSVNIFVLRGVEISNANMFKVLLDPPLQ